MLFAFDDGLSVGMKAKGPNKYFEPNLLLNFSTTYQYYAHIHMHDMQT